MAGTQSLFCSTSQNCQGQGKGIFIQKKGLCCGAAWLHFGTSITLFCTLTLSIFLQLLFIFLSRGPRKYSFDFSAAEYQAVSCVTLPQLCEDGKQVGVYFPSLGSLLGMFIAHGGSSTPQSRSCVSPAWADGWLRIVLGDI